METLYIVHTHLVVPPTTQSPPPEPPVPKAVYDMTALLLDMEKWS